MLLQVILSLINSEVINMEKEYVTPDMQFEGFKVEDIITTSDPIDNPPDENI